jgi:sulfoxide reductase heme-binding subunit YedZ
MNKPTLIALKTLAWIACLTPAAILASDAITNRLGPDPTKALIHSTGESAINLLAISLAITPLRKLFPRLSWLIKFRRLFGLFAFFYASLHLLTYVGLYSYFDPRTIFDDVVKRRFITAGMAAWLLLVPLAITSTTGWIRRLGGKRWNQLHKLVYVSISLGVLHYWWQVKPGVLDPLNITVIVFALFLARPILDWWNRRKRSPQQPGTTTPAR